MALLAAGPTFEEAVRPGASSGGEPWPILDDLAYLCTAIVNVIFVGREGARDREWTLVDTGMFGSADRIARAAERRYGPNSRPAAIVLTHGHFDHIGAVHALAERWSAPVYAHALEFPYLTGRSSYPPPDPSVGGGMMAALSFLYPRGPIDLDGWLVQLPDDGSIPSMPGWRWVHTPGHAPGHVSLFRDEDRALIAGDAFITTKQESALAVMTQEAEIHGPPMYFTPDWGAAGESVRALEALGPEVVVTGHGLPLRGESMRAALTVLAREFERRAVPARGVYVDRPAVMDWRGVVSSPTPPVPVLPATLIGLGLGAVAGLALSHRRR